MTDLKSLIAELEQAKEGGRRLDYGIASLLGRSVPRFVDIEKITSSPEAEVVRLKGGGVSTGFRPLHYTASLDAALTLVPEDWSGGGRLVGLPPYGMELLATDGLKIRLPGPKLVNSSGATPALALCIAALKAREK